MGCIKAPLPSLTVNVVDKERLTAQSNSRKTKVRPLDRRSRYFLIDRITETTTICKSHHSRKELRVHFRTFFFLKKYHTVPQQSISHFLFFQLLIKCLPRQLRFLIEAQSGLLQGHTGAPEVDRPEENRLRQHRAREESRNILCTCTPDFCGY